MLLPVALSGCGSAAASGGAGGDPLAGETFYVNPQNIAAQQAAQWRSEGRTESSEILARMAAQPTATWFGESAHVKSEVQALTTRAAQASRSALLVAYDIPDRDCGGYSSGGAGSGGAYRRWIEQFAAGIGDRTATVILEPDAIAEALSHCLSAAFRAERYALLRFAVRKLKAHRHVSVYIDAGNVGWIRPSQELLGPLQASGIARADGFSLNVSNFYTTASTITYGAVISKRLDGKHFVIDTSRNGNGPDTSPEDEPTWCNPPGRALGTAPTSHTGNPLVDAYLWIKQPGQSDGSCRPGEPRAGQWWPQYALELAGGGHTTEAE
jgi:endoglucanase